MGWRGLSNRLGNTRKSNGFPSHRRFLPAAITSIRLTRDVVQTGELRMIAWKNWRNSLTRVPPAICPPAPSMADTNPLWAPENSWHFPPSVGSWTSWGCRQIPRHWKTLKTLQGGTGGWQVEGIGIDRFSQQPLATSLRSINHNYSVGMSQVVQPCSTIFNHVQPTETDKIHGLQWHQ